MSDTNELERRRQELAERLSQSTNNIQIAESVNSIQDMTRQLSDGLNTAELKRDADKEAKDFVESVAEYYLDEKIRKMKMIKKKIKADTANISTVIFTLKINEHTMAKCLQIIDLGNAPAPMFQVMAKLGEQSVNASKHQSMERNQLTDTYRLLKSESSSIMHEAITNELEAKDAQDVGATTEDSIVRTRGTKQLVERIKLENEENPREKTLEETTAIRKTDPKNRPTDVGFEPEIEIIDESSMLDIDDDIFNN